MMALKNRWLKCYHSLFVPSIQPERNKRWQRQTKTTQSMFGLTRRQRRSVGEGTKNCHIKQETATKSHHVSGASSVVLTWHWSRRKRANSCLYTWTYGQYLHSTCEWKDTQISISTCDKFQWKLSDFPNTEPLCSGGDKPPPPFCTSSTMNEH